MKQWFVNRHTNTYYRVDMSSGIEIVGKSLTLEVVVREPKRNKLVLTEAIEIVVEKDFVLKDCERLAKMKVPRKVRRALS